MTFLLLGTHPPLCHALSPDRLVGITVEAEPVTNVQHAVTGMGFGGKILDVAVNNGSNPATHFGKQMKKERLAHGWGLREFAQMTGLNPGHLSRIENGKRPPTENVASACDAAFPERRGWFTESYEELRGWSEVPAAFRNWAELEEKAVRLCDWWPSIVIGLLQTGDYARALIDTVPGTTQETAAARLASRIERQRRVLGRDAPPRSPSSSTSWPCTAASAPPR